MYITKCFLDSTPSESKFCNVAFRVSTASKVVLVHFAKKMSKVWQLLIWFAGFCSFTLCMLYIIASESGFTNHMTLQFRQSEEHPKFDGIYQKFTWNGTPRIESLIFNICLGSIYFNLPKTLNACCIDRDQCDRTVLAYNFMQNEFLINEHINLDQTEQFRHIDIYWKR